MKIEFVVTNEFEGCRLDYLVAIKADGYSRSLIAQLIKRGDILVAGKIKKPSSKLHSGDVVSGILYEEQNQPFIVSAEDSFISKNIKRQFDIIHEDSHILVINKNSGVVVHPAPGNLSGTLVDSIISYCPQIRYVGEDISRPGIVHRLDRDTSGVMVVAKDEQSFLFLKNEFMQRRVEKRYIALVAGNLKEDSGRIILPIGRHPVKRKMMSIAENGRYAETLWQVRQRYGYATLVDAELKTGRTHQVRVHFKALGHPLVGDSVYGFKRDGAKRGLQFNLKNKKVDSAVKLQNSISNSASKHISRHMLHAWKLSFIHPWSGRRVEFIAPLPDDMTEFIDFV